MHEAVKIVPLFQFKKQKEKGRCIKPIQFKVENETF